MVEINTTAFSLNKSNLHGVLRMNMANVLYENRL